MYLGTQPGEYKDLSGVTTGIYSNGTIRFEHVKKSDEGSYLCEARNEVGSGLSKVVFLKVNGMSGFLSCVIHYCNAFPHFAKLSLHIS